MFSVSRSVNIGTAKYINSESWTGTVPGKTKLLEVMALQVRLDERRETKSSEQAEDEEKEDEEEEEDE